jgi:3-oxoacyl-[acyl-carrier protein] reductase
VGRFDGRAVFITGSTRGIGLAAARAFADEGALVGVCGRCGADADRVARSIGGRGYELDVFDRVRADSVIADFADSAGRLDVLVNNAGITGDRMLSRMEDADWEAVMGTNLSGVKNCTRAALKVMVRARGGRIINVASTRALVGAVGQANYAAAKGGVLSFTRTVAREVAGRNITVNAVVPGLTETDMTAGLDEKTRGLFMDNIPLGRFAMPAEIARAMVFLASDDASYMTGQALRVNGGLAMHGWTVSA